MTIASILQKRWSKWLLALLFWTLIGLSFASQFYSSAAKAGLEVTWKRAVIYALGDWYVFALLSIPVIQLARRFHFEAGRWGISLAVHVLGSIAFSMAYMVLRAGIGSWQSGATFPDAFRPLLAKTWFFNLLVYWVIVVVSYAFQYYRRYRERELRALELEKRLAQAKLQALQMQLNPHFLFNTLHSISSLMHKDVEAADRMIVRLSDLLRAALESSDTQEIELQEELDFLRRYLEIEQTRLGDRLTVKMEIAPETLRARVPNLILQPLVENAIRHGIEPRARPGRIELRAQRKDGTLALEVRDNGIGIKVGEQFDEGVGLSNTRARLRGLYGDAHQFQLRAADGGGLLIEMRIPFNA
ncbi:MAG TPA: histidine kinase [Candidatus Limnocylindrales bacterium]|jgi:signal transduction histidine kinase|nr:histidine kinase [Candidatus Limnocylindrales bacterium]